MIITHPWTQDKICFCKNSWYIKSLFFLGLFHIYRFYLTIFCCSLTDWVLCHVFYIDTELQSSSTVFSKENFKWRLPCLWCVAVIKLRTFDILYWPLIVAAMLTMFSNWCLCRTKNVHTQKYINYVHIVLQDIEIIV